MTSLTSLKNIGPKSARWLQAVGIHTAENLDEIGVVEAYRRVKDAFPGQVSLNMLWALQGAVLNIPYTEIPEGLKEKLKAEVGEE